MPISVEGTDKNQQDPGQEIFSSFVTLFFVEILLMKTFRGGWIIFLKEKPSLGSLLFGTFLSALIPKGTKDACVHFFIHSSKLCKL